MKKSDEFDLLESKGGFCLALEYFLCWVDENCEKRTSNKN